MRRRLIAVVNAVYRRLNGSLRARLIVPIAVLAMASSALMAATAMELHVGDLSRASQERGRLFATLAADSIGAHMANFEHSDISALLRALAEHRPDIAGLNLIGSDGRVTATTQPQLRGTEPWSQVQLYEESLLRTPGAASFAVINPIPNDERCGGCHGEQSRAIAYLEVRFTDSLLDASQQRLAGSLAVAALPALALMITIAWWLLGREAIRPIQRLVVAMHSAEKGKDVKADEGRSDEIGLATRGFDATLAALRNSQVELHRMYEERMVRADRFAMVGQMATGLAHEIKNPLAGLSGALELLAEDLARNQHHAEVVAEMRHQVKRLAAIMDGLLSFARPPTARLVATSLNAPMEKALFLIAQQRAAQKVSIDQKLDPELPTVHADPAQLEQVFLNIGLNAFHAVSGTGGTITVRTFRAGGQVVAELSDTGPGIPPEVRPHIFTPFFTTRPTGTGLGLALSMRLVTQAGGTLVFQCPPTGGTTFTVTLPITEAREPDLLAPASPGEEAVAKPDA